MGKMNCNVCGQVLTIVTRTQKDGRTANEVLCPICGWRKVWLDPLPTAEIIKQDGSKISVYARGRPSKKK